MNRRGFLGRLHDAPAGIVTPGLLMPRTDVDRSPTRISCGWAITLYLNGRSLAATAFMTTRQRCKRRLMAGRF